MRILQTVVRAHFHSFHRPSWSQIETATGKNAPIHRTKITALSAKAASTLLCSSWAYLTSVLLDKTVEKKTTSQQRRALVACFFLVLKLHLGDFPSLRLQNAQSHRAAFPSKATTRSGYFRRHWLAFIGSAYVIARTIIGRKSAIFVATHHQRCWLASRGSSFHRAPLLRRSQLKTFVASFM